MGDSTPAGIEEPPVAAGSKEGVYIISTVATPQEKGGGKPIVALPNPFYQAYLGGAFGWLGGSASVTTSTGTVQGGEIAGGFAGEVELHGSLREVHVYAG